jgi:hypothetical protein
MKKYILLLAVFSLLGCSGYAVKAPTTNNTAKLKHVEPLDIQVKELPKLPTAKHLLQDGEEYAAFDLQGMNDLLQFRTYAKTNTEVLKEVLLAYKASVDERNAMVDAAKAAEDRSNLIAEKWAETEGELQKKKDTVTFSLSVLSIFAFGLLL